MTRPLSRFADAADVVLAAALESTLARCWR
jgi:hypothetical protein